MLSMIPKKKKTIDALREKYLKLIRESYQIALTDSDISKRKAMEAEEIQKQIDILMNRDKD